MKLVCYEYIATVEFMQQAMEPERYTTELVNSRVSKYLDEHPELVADGERQILQVPVKWVESDDYTGWEQCDVVDAEGFKFTVIQPAREVR